MKKIRITIILAFLAILTQPLAAQGIQWSAKAKKISSNIYNIEITASVPEGYHMYDMGPYGADGPIAASITLVPGKKVALQGALKAPASHKYDDVMYGMQVGAYEGKVKFTQEVSGKKGAKVTVKARAQACSSQNCLPPKEEELVITLQ